jgi:hypothetical protein
VTTPHERRTDALKWLALKWLAVLFALGVCVVGGILLWGVWYGTPVAAPFTRVGGASRVETALEASRFWLTPPRYVVETGTHASQVMLGAAQCAVALDAPLLFTSPDPRVQRQVTAAINYWRKIETPKGVVLPDVSTIKNQLDLGREVDPPLPEVITIGKHTSIARCPPQGRETDVPRLSTLKVSNPLVRFRHVPCRRTLARVVVFAAAIEPGHPPDVAVGLALAAHLARANRERVSLVVVPHYLESDPDLERKLRSQHELVTGGVVLGQTPTVPEDTRALLRQLLTSRDGHGVLAQLQENLGSAGALIGALLALAGATTAIVAPVLIEREEKARRAQDGEYKPIGIITSIKYTGVFIIKMPPRIIKILQEVKGVIVGVKQSDWLVGLPAEQKVTIFLRSGRQVSGIIDAQLPPKTRDATVLRVKKEVSPPGTDLEYALVPVSDIELIEYNAPVPKAGHAPL